MPKYSVRILNVIKQKNDDVNFKSWKTKILKILVN